MIEIKIYPLFFYLRSFLWKKFVKTDRPWGDRADAVVDNDKYNRHFSIYIQEKTLENFLSGYTSYYVLDNFEGVPSQE